MGCTQSTHVVQQKRLPIEVKQLVTQKQPQPKKQMQKSFIKQIPERGQCFLIGSLNEKQQVFANVKLQSMSINKMSIPTGGFVCRNFSSILEIQKGKYFISGGINHDLTQISNDCFLYFSHQHQVEKLLPMNQARYTHASIFLPQKNSVYVIGGRYYGDDSKAILSDCEKYLIDQKTWVKLPDMNVKRCTCFCFTYNKSVYVLGGYTGPYERSTKIQYLNQDETAWKILDVQLNRGLQGAILLPTSPNQITVFGGLVNSGPTDSVISINLDKKSIKSKKKLKEKRSLYKSFYKNGKVYIFGGDDNFTGEIYDIQKETSQLMQKQWNFQAEEFDMFGFSTGSVHVQSLKSQRQSLNQSQLKEQSEILYIVGTTEEPFLCQLNISMPQTKFKEVPLTLKLYSRQGGVFIDKNKLFLFGGIQDESLSVISSESYLYNIKQNTAMKMSKMNQNRYAFSYQLTKNSQNKPDYVYCFGGATSNPEGKIVFLSACERYITKENKWELISPLPQKLSNTMNVCFKGNIFVFGGTTEKFQKSKQIFIYHKTQNTWQTLQSKLQIGLDSGSLVSISQSQFYVFGGRFQTGQTDSIFSLSINEKIQKKKKHYSCNFKEIGKMNEKKSIQKIYKPSNQEIFVVFGGNHHSLTFYKKNLEQETSNMLSNIKTMFMKTLDQINNKDLKDYLIIGKNQN